MGNTCTTEPKEQFEDKVDNAVDAVKETAEDVKAKDSMEDVNENEKETSELAKDAEAHAAAGVQEKAKDIAESVKEKIEDAVERAKELVGGTTEEKPEAIAETVQERVADAVTDAVAEVKEAAASAAETVADTMTAAVAAVSGTMIVEFDDGKGTTKSVDFKNKALGFTVARSSGGGCCTSVPKAKVVVSKVEKNQQADKLGVKRGWEVKAINGTHVAGLEEATKLLDDGKAKLVEA